MAGLDEAVGNLEDFNALAAQTSERLTDDTSSLTAQRNTLDGLEQDAGDAWDRLSDGLDDLQERFEDGESKATEGVDAVGDLAADIFDARLVTAQGTLDETGQTIEAGLASSRQEIEQDWTDLKGEGFEAAASEAASIAAETEGLTSGTEGAFSDLASGADSDERQVADAQASASEAAAGFAGDVSSQEAGAQAVGELAATLTEAMGELGTATSAFDSDLSQAYADLGQETEDSAEAMVDEITGVMDEAAQYVETEAAGRTESLLATTVDDVTAALLTTLAETTTALEAGATVTDACIELIPELAKAQEKLAEIDQLLDALRG